MSEDVPARKGPPIKPHGKGTPLWAHRLRALREGRNLSIRALAEACGVEPRTMGDYDAGRYPPPITVGVQLARLLDTTVDDLFG